MVSAIFSFTIMDAIVKGLAPDIGIMPTLWARYAGQMLIVTVLIWPRRRVVVRTKYPKIQILRSFALMGATWFFFTGLANIGLAEASAIMGVNPVLITLGAALFLGERLGVRRVVGILAAMIGALIIIRPGSDLFSVYAIFPLLAAACYSCYALLTRFVGSDEDVWTSLFYTGLVGMLILSAMLPFVWQGANGTDWVKMAAIAFVGTTGQLLLIRALRLGEASMLAPFSYTGLIFAIFWGALFYNEFPDQWTLIGAVIIAAAGIYVWYRETFRK